MANHFVSMPSVSTIDSKGIVTSASIQMGVSTIPYSQHRYNHGYANSTSPSNFDLGAILASYGYVPRATYRPANIPPPFHPASSAGVPAQQFTQPAFLSRSRISNGELNGCLDASKGINQTITHLDSSHKAKIFKIPVLPSYFFKNLPLSDQDS